MQQEYQTCLDPRTGHRRLKGGVLEIREPTGAATKKLFDKLDGDKDGRISAAEFQRGMAGKRKQELRGLLGAVGMRWRDVLNTIDTNHDGFISLDEFRIAVKQAGGGGARPAIVPTRRKAENPIEITVRLLSGEECTLKILATETIKTLVSETMAAMGLRGKLDLFLNGRSLGSGGTLKENGLSDGCEVAAVVDPSSRPAGTYSLRASKSYHFSYGMTLTLGSDGRFTFKYHQSHQYYSEECMSAAGDWLLEDTTVILTMTSGSRAFDREGHRVDDPYESCPGRLPGLHLEWVEGTHLRFLDPSYGKLEGDLILPFVQ